LSLNVTSGVGGFIGGSGTYSDWSIIEYNQFVVIYWNSGVNRRLNVIDLAPSQTCIWLHYSWDGGTTESSQSFVISPNLGGWGFGATSTPGNYYDNVKAYKKRYRRTGIDDWWGWYTYLADAFWSNPVNDLGQSYGSSPDEFHFPNRSKSLEGMMLRAQEVSSMWPQIILGINDSWNYLNAANTNTLWQYDAREAAYSLHFIALDAQLNPNSTQIALDKTHLSTVMSGLYTSGRKSDGSFPSGEFSVTDTTHSCSVVQGSTSVTCTGANLALITTDAPYFVTYDGFPTPPATPNCSAFRSTVYQPTVTGANTLTLDKPYVETSGTVGWATGAAGGPQYPVGCGNQGFINGILSTGFNETYLALVVSDPTNSAKAKSNELGLSNFITKYDYSDPFYGGVGGVYYFEAFLTCNYPNQTLDCQRGIGASESRTDAIEVIRSLYHNYVNNPTTPELTFLTTLYDQLWCKPGTGGTCTTDGFYLTDFNDNQTYESNAPSANKWWGWFDGYAGGDSASVTIYLASLGQITTRCPTTISGGVSFSGGVYASICSGNSTN
ncbi:MAG TPA: hypothetical protein VNX68_13155, partial [Nitrosopumilaceae archaeon]|nr:hypothetical protein [Nitrosopumilaceae archaeon]